MNIWYVGVFVYLFACTCAYIVKLLSRLCALHVCGYRRAMTDTSPISAWAFLSLCFSQCCVINSSPGLLLQILPFMKERQNRCWSPSTCVRVTSKPTRPPLIVSEAFITIRSSPLGLLVWAWDYNIPFVTPSLWLFHQIQVFISYLPLSVYPSVSHCLDLLSVYPHKPDFQRRCFGDSLKALNVFAKDTSELSFW